MYDFLNKIAEDNEWHYQYGRADYQNLIDDIEADKVSLFVDPITSESKFSDAGNETVNFSGKLMLLLQSDVDEAYKNKYTEYIRPLFDNARSILIEGFVCSEFELNLFKTTEVINLFDQNMDGLLITYSTTKIN